MKWALALIFIALLPFITVFLGCKESSKFRIGEHQSQSYPIQFKSAAFKKVPYGAVYAIAYESEGEVANKSSLILESAFIDLGIVFLLENGNTIGNTELDPNPFPIPSYQIYIKRHITHGDKVNFILSSPRVRKEYGGYPIKSVFIVYSIKGNDPVNGSEFYGIIRQVDVTSEWMKFIQNFDDKHAD